MIRTALSLGVSKDLCIDLHPLQELLSAARMSDVFNADVDALLKIPVAYDLANDNSYSTRRNVEDDARFATKRATVRLLLHSQEMMSSLDLPVVELVGHATLDGWVRLNVHQIANPVGFKVG